MNQLSKLFLAMLLIGLPLAATQGETRRPAWPAVPTMSSNAQQDSVDRIAAMLEANGAPAARAADAAPYVLEFAALQRVPADLVVGIIAVENRELVARSTSSVGAQGIMQVMPGWLNNAPRTRATCGSNLRSTRTNICWGTYVLRVHLDDHRGSVRRGLLAYNGCKATPGCDRYPDQVFRLAGQASILTSF